jgi:hypothetical protein
MMSRTGLLGYGWAATDAAKSASNSARIAERSLGGCGISVSS